jgi:CheY-like chemotaxis protein
MNTNLLWAGLAAVVVVVVVMLLLRRRPPAEQRPAPRTEPPQTEPMAAPVSRPQPAAEAAQRQAATEGLRQARRRAEAERLQAEQLLQQQVREQARQQAQAQGERQAELAARQRALAEQQARQRAQEQAQRQAQRLAQQQAAQRAHEQAIERAATPAAAPPGAAQQHPVDPRAPGLAVPPIAWAGAAPAGPPLVLVVDDSKVVRIKTGRLLEKQGYRVQVADDGQGALQCMQAETPDLVITDVEMPGLDGFELTRRLHAQPRWARVPVIMITSSDEKHRAEATAAGVSVLLGKPYAEEDLLAQVRQLLGQAAQRAVSPLAVH